MLLSAVMERPLVSVQTKQEYVQAIYDRYRGARRPEKQRILDEFCAVTKQHRKHAIRLLNGPAPGAARPRRTARRAVWAGDHRRVADDLGSGGLSLVRPAQGPAAAVAAVGPPPAGPAPGRGAAVAAHQPAADRSPARAPAPPAPQAAVRADQARHPAQAPHPPQDGSLGRRRRPASRRSTSSRTAAATATGSSCTRSM